jgi:hypothetical protein
MLNGIMASNKLYIADLDVQMARLHLNLPAAQCRHNGAAWSRAMTARHRFLERLVAIALAALAVSACAGNDDTAARFLVAPGKYRLFNCQQLGHAATKNLERQRELEALIARAGPETGGQVVSAVAYRPEYLSLQGDIMDMRQVAVDKKCDFVPGDPSTRTLSGGAIR